MVPTRQVISFPTLVLTVVQGLRYFEGDPNTAADVAQWTNPAKEISAYHAERPMTLYKGPHSLLRVLAPKYRLNKAEYLQLYNVRPTSRITLELIIEEVCDLCLKNGRG
jgi:hypothetical protein